MDIFISNVPSHSNRVELSRFLRDTVENFDILAYDVMKKGKANWAILTTADANNARQFLRIFGGFNPSLPLYFKKAQLGFKRSKTEGQPDVLKVRVLRDKEAAMRAKRSKQPPAPKGASANPIFPFTSFQTGVWGYDVSEKLVFDSKHRDLRRGTITFGRWALAVYLAAVDHQGYQRHTRIDIPYGIIEHAIPSDDNSENGRKGNITLTLRYPPKIYRIVDTESLHLYTGTEPAIDPLASHFSALKLGPQKQKLVRETSIMEHLPNNSALCMVYRFNLPDSTSAQRAWSHISKLSALPRNQAWKSMVLSRNTPTIETEFADLEKLLDSYDRADLSKSLTFAVRFQLLTIVLEGSISPAAMIDLVPHVQILCDHYGPDLVARGVRKLQYQIPTPGPDVESKELGPGQIVSALAQNIRDIKVSVAYGYPHFPLTKVFDYC
jgi:hypothetical protein